MSKNSCIVLRVRSVLLAWIGNTDLRAPTEGETSGDGPIAQALVARRFDEAWLISDHEDRLVAPYVKWLKSKSSARIEVLPERLSGPTDFGQIYQAAVRSVERALGDRARNTKLT